MKYPPAFLDEIRARLTPSDIIGRRVNLKSKGRGEHVGLCPFHSEKTPSFTVSDQKGFYHCFGCGKTGDVLGFTVDTQGVSFGEAIKILAEEAGLALPEISKEEKQAYEKAVTLRDVTEAACKWFQGQLRLSEGKEALSYLHDRGVNDQAIKTFCLGYAPDDFNALKNAMLEKGFTQSQLLEVGLLRKKDNSKDTYDYFRGRIIFPIMDARGRAVAFGGRALGDGQPKYLNSPETELFHKGHMIYNLNLARETAYKKESIVLVEGYMDVIAMHIAGIKNTVATMGTAVTKEQLQLLWRVVKEPIICLDGDEAGKNAMAKIAENNLDILQPGYSMRFAVLPTGEDPDDVLQKHGADSMRKILEQASPLSEVLWDISYSEDKVSTPEQKAAFEKKIMKLIGGIKNSSVQTYYKNHFNERIFNELKKIKRDVKYSSTSQELKTFNATKSPSECDQYEKHLIYAVLNAPQILQDLEIEGNFIHIQMDNPALNDLHCAIIELLSDEKFDINTENLRVSLENKGFSNHIKELDNDAFLDKLSILEEADEELIKSGWKYMLARYNFMKVDDEYNNKANNEQVTETTLELQKQKDLLKKLAEREKMSYEAALDDKAFAE